MGLAKFYNFTRKEGEHIREEANQGPKKETANYFQINFLLDNMNKSHFGGKKDL